MSPRWGGSGELNCPQLRTTKLKSQKPPSGRGLHLQERCLWGRTRSVLVAQLFHEGATHFTQISGSFLCPLFSFPKRKLSPGHCTARHGRFRELEETELPWAGSAPHLQSRAEPTGGAALTDAPGWLGSSAGASPAPWQHSLPRKRSPLVPDSRGPPPQRRLCFCLLVPTSPPQCRRRSPM